MVSRWRQAARGKTVRAQGNQVLDNLTTSPALPTVLCAAVYGNVKDIMRVLINLMTTKMLFAPGRRRIRRGAR